ncbi:MAG: amylo-alpha-1,6-glucosidase [Bryobacter sp.]|nr:amylo-alpha-1,6-glucosidase [Bryobacter sp.]
MTHAPWGELSFASRLEWLDTNSRGFYAMGTPAGIRTRRYHGLLVGPAKPQAPQCVWVNAVEEEISFGGELHLLHAHQYAGVVVPKGYEAIAKFQATPCPTWLYRLGEASLEKELLLVENQPAVLLRYCCSENARMRLRPLVSGRHHHQLFSESVEAPFQTVYRGESVELRREDASLYFDGEFQHFQAAPDWYFRFEYAKEKNRGLDFREDLYTPGIFELDLPADTWVSFRISLAPPQDWSAREALNWREGKQARFPRPKNMDQRLANAARHFIFHRDSGPSVIAGYPWFTDWGRDTFISLPGLLLAQPNHADTCLAAQIIQQFLQLRSHGLIPNRITDDGSTPEYNSIDATLWMFIAIFYWREAGGDRNLFRDTFYPALIEILATLERGTLYAIHCDPSDGLLSAGTMETQLTWMDARVYGVPVTPRFGKAVEINALWYNALRLLTDWARELGDFPTEKHFGALANRTISGFTTLFWHEAGGYLFDVIRPGYRDTRIRPNQLFAISLPYPLVVRSKAEQILGVVEEYLLTPFGLRTLSPQDPQYKARYEGGPENRDGAYHQGTVWPWLFGPYMRACLRTRGRHAEEVNRCRKLLEPLLESLDEGCLEQIAEVYDADAPHRPGGTPAQAWSVAEIRWLLAKELRS